MACTANPFASGWFRLRASELVLPTGLAQTHTRKLLMSTSFQPTRPAHPVRRQIKMINIEPELISNEEGPVAKIVEAIQSVEAQLEIYDYPKFAHLQLVGALATLTMAHGQVKNVCEQAQQEVELQNRQHAKTQQKQKLTLVRSDGKAPN